MHCIVFLIVALYYIILYCTVLYCIELYFIASYCCITLYRLLSVVSGSFNQPALRALRVLRPLKLVTGFSS